MCHAYICLKTGGVDGHLGWYMVHGLTAYLCTEAVERLALALKRVDDIEGCDSLATSMFAIRDRILDDVAEERAENGAGLLVHQSGDALDTATTSQTTDRRFRDALDVITQHLTVALSTALAAFTTFARHDF